MLLFLADQPQAPVAPGTPGWFAWVPIAISLLALTVSGLQFSMNRAERRRVMPKVKVLPFFTDQYKFAALPRKVISASMANEGREGTNLIDILVYTGDSQFSVAGRLLNNSGHGVDEPVTREIGGFSETTIYIDASEIGRRDVGLTFEFGHAVDQHFYIPLNGRAEQKQYFSRRYRLLRRSVPAVFAARSHAMQRR